MTTRLALLSILAAVSSLSAQSITLPPVPNTVGVAWFGEGNSSSSTLWGTTSTTVHQRNQCLYGAASFGDVGPIIITQLSWRLNSASTVAVGGTVGPVTITLSTSPLTVATRSTTFANNVGGDVVTVYTGPVTITPVTAPSVSNIPGPWYVTLPLGAPFSYNPALGDLLVDVSWAPGSGSAAGSAADLETSTGVQSARISSNTSTTLPATGTSALGGWIMRFDYSPQATTATKSAYGAGCMKSTSSFYEFWTTTGGMDLANTTLTLTPSGGGYQVASTAGSTMGPVGAAYPSTLTAGSLDDGYWIQPLPFTFNFPGGSTSTIWVCTNGYIFLSTPPSLTGNNFGSTDWSPSPQELLWIEPRLAPMWHDWNLNSPSGQIHFDIAASNDVICLTWNGVLGTGASAAGPQTFQCLIRNTGVVEYRYFTVTSVLGSTSTSRASLVGFSAGTLGGNRSQDPGNIDLSATGAFTTGTEILPLSLAADNRPVLGNSLTMTVSRNPLGASFGLVWLSFTQHDPGLDLSSYGMPTCSQFAGFDFVHTWVSSPAASYQTSTIGPIPNDPSWLGAPVFAQAATVGVAVNAGGVITSNGIAYRFHAQ